MNVHFSLCYSGEMITMQIEVYLKQVEVKNYLKIIEKSATYYQTYSLSFQHFILHNYYYSHWMILYFATPALHC